MTSNKTSASRLKAILKDYSKAAELQHKADARREWEELVKEVHDKAYAEGYDTGWFDCLEGLERNSELNNK